VRSLASVTAGLAPGPAQGLREGSPPRGHRDL